MPNVYKVQLAIYDSMSENKYMYIEADRCYVREQSLSEWFLFYKNDESQPVAMVDCMNVISIEKV